MSAIDVETLLAMLEHAPGFICFTDTDANIRYLNRTAEGFSLEETIGKSWYDFLLPEQAAVVRAAFERVLASGETQDSEHCIDTPLGMRLWLLTRVAALRGEDGKVRGLITIITDITEKRAAEERLRTFEKKRVEDALRRQASRTEKILDTAMDGYLLLDRDSIIIDVNDAYCGLVGCSRSDVLGTELAGMASGGPGEPSLEERLGSMLDSGRKQSFELTHRTEHGHIVELEASASPLHLDDTPLIVLFVRDVTARRRAEAERELLEAQLHQQQKLQSLGTLASGVAHEINNPIQGILGFAQLICHRSPADHEVHKFASEIVVECKRIARIVNDLLTFARDERDRGTPARIDEIVNATLSLIRSALAADRIAVALDLPATLTTVSCRSHKIQQVLMNLLTNARDALNERYPQPHADKRIHIAAESFERQGCEWVRILVEDFGVGIDPDVMPRIFDPFFTTKDRNAGTGLGLSVSHGIIKEHRGELRVESERGRFTRFCVELPADDQAVQDSPLRSAVPRAARAASGADR